MTLLLDKNDGSSILLHPIRINAVTLHNFSRIVHSLSGGFDDDQKEEASFLRIPEKMPEKFFPFLPDHKSHSCMETRLAR